VYYLAVNSDNLGRFYTYCIQKYPEASKLKAEWDVLFDFLKDKTETIIIDEFQNMIKEDENILNLFQYITDVILKDSNIKLFLLGSSVSIMTSKVLSYKSPLYGRRTGSIELKSIDFYNISEFFPNTTIKELIEIYGFAEGIPFYLNKIDMSFWSWMDGEINEWTSFLKDEIDFLMRYEFFDVGTYKLILEAISNGKTKLNDIKGFMNVKRTDISPYMSNLVDVRMIKRVVSVTENIKSRKGRYYISDNFIWFWFRYIYPNLNMIEEGIFDINIIKKEYSTYLGFVFEKISTQFFIRNKDKIFNFTKIGRWWHKDKEIDIVALNDDTKDILFVECKWKDLSLRQAEKIMSDLKEKSVFVDWNLGVRKEYFGLVAKKIEGKEELKAKGFVVFDLDDF